MGRLSLKHYQDSAPLKATHVLKVDGKYYYAEHDGIHYHLLNKQGNRKRISYQMGDKGWFIVEHLRVTSLISTKEAPYRERKKLNMTIKVGKREREC